MWLTWRKRYIPIAERQEAGRDIIATMPDCAIGERINVRAYESAHAFMREVMHSCIDLEYWRDEPKGVQRDLVALGMHLRGEFEAELLLDVYDTVVAQAQADKLTDHLRQEYPSDFVKKIGF